MSSTPLILSVGELNVSIGTSGSDTRDSEYHTSDCDEPRGVFASFLHMMRDALSVFSFTNNDNSGTGSMSSHNTTDEEGGAGGGGAGAGARDKQHSARKLFSSHHHCSHGNGYGHNKSSGRAATNHYDQIKAPLLGVEVGFSEAQTLAQEVDNINTQGTVKLLNFAYLSLQNKGWYCIAYILCYISKYYSFRLQV